VSGSSWSVIDLTDKAWIGPLKALELFYLEPCTVCHTQCAVNSVNKGQGV